MADIEYCPDNDCYAILEVAQGCDETTLKRAHKRFTLLLHPDKQPFHARQEAHEPFVRMQNAYELLSDSSTRRMYDKKRGAYFRNKFWYHEKYRDYNFFDEWRIDEIKKIEKKEQEGRQQYDKVRERWQKEARDKRQEEQQQKEQQKHEQQDHEQKRREQEKTRQAELEKELKDLNEDIQSMKRDYDVWDAQQKIMRESEVEARENELRHMKQQHEQADKDLEIRLAQKREVELKKLEAQLKTKGEKERDGQLKRQEKELANRNDKHERQRDAQRQHRKRVREDYSLWVEQAEQDKEDITCGRPSGYAKRRRPTFYQPKYGFTKNGQPCQKCMQAAGFCKLHKDQE